MDKNIHQHKKKHKEKKETISCMSTFCSWEDVLGFRETYAVIFET